MTHFGASEDVDAQLDAVGRRLDEWVAHIPELKAEEFIESIRREIVQGPEPELLPQYTQAAPPDQLYAGMKRYLEKRAEAVDESAQGSGVS